MVGETIETYCGDLKMLYEKAHPSRPADIKESDLIRKFLNGLLSKKCAADIEFYKSPSTLDETVEMVINYQETMSVSGVSNSSGGMITGTCDSIVGGKVVMSESENSDSEVSLQPAARSVRTPPSPRKKKRRNLGADGSAPTGRSESNPDLPVRRSVSHGADNNAVRHFPPYKQTQHQGVVIHLKLTVGGPRCALGVTRSLQTISDQRTAITVVGLTTMPGIVKTFTGM